MISIPGAIAHQLGLTTGSAGMDILVESLVWMPYYVLFTASAWQATPGKRAFGIKVTDLDGGRVSLGRSFMRYLASFLSAFALMVGYLMVPFTKKRQAMHDLMVGTLVVNAEAGPGALPADGQVMPLTPRVSAGVAAMVFLFLAYVALSAFLMETPDELKAASEVPAEPTAGPSYQLGYALYALPFFGGEPKLVKEGTLSYRLSDVRVRPGPASDSSVKRLDVAEGFSVEAHIYREPAVQGFGLSLEKDSGFSWEWFDLEEGYVFRKLRGPGRIQVRMDTRDGKEEVAEILFLEDVTLRIDRLWLLPFTRSETDHLVVKKGSVLRLKN